METNEITPIQQTPNLEYGYHISPSVMILNVHNPEVKSGVFVGAYQGDSFSTIINSFAPNHVIDLLIRAVNNRTIERNYFRLYAQLLEGTITEDLFDQEIEKNESEYVIETENKPSKEDINVVLHLASYIKGMNNSSDLSTLFSFDPDETDRLLALPEICDGNL